VVASAPSGATKQIVSGVGLSSGRTPSSTSSSFSSGTPRPLRHSVGGDGSDEPSARRPGL
jgi:hypothetical protein